VKTSIIDSSAFMGKIFVYIEIAVDTVAGDTAKRIIFTEIAEVNTDSAKFACAVDILDFRNMVNAISNFLKMKDKVEGPMFYTVNEELKMIFRREEGLKMTDVKGQNFLIETRWVDSFRGFLQNLGLGI
jgi:hypothetical protein